MTDHDWQNANGGNLCHWRDADGNVCNAQRDTPFHANARTIVDLA